MKALSVFISIMMLSFAFAGVAIAQTVTGVTNSGANAGVDFRPSTTSYYYSYGGDETPHVFVQPTPQIPNLAILPMPGGWRVWCDPLIPVVTWDMLKDNKRLRPWDGVKEFFGRYKPDKFWEKMEKNQGGITIVCPDGYQPDEVNLSPKMVPQFKIRKGIDKKIGENFSYGSTSEPETSTIFDALLRAKEGTYTNRAIVLIRDITATEVTGLSGSAAAAMAKSMGSEAHPSAVDGGISLGSVIGFASGNMDTFYQVQVWSLNDASKIPVVPPVVAKDPAKPAPVPEVTFLMPLMFEIGSYEIKDQDESLDIITKDIVTNRHKAKKEGGLWHLVGTTCPIQEMIPNLFLGENRSQSAEKAIYRIAKDKYKVDPSELKGLIKAVTEGEEYVVYTNPDEYHKNRAVHVYYSVKRTGEAVKIPSIKTDNKRSKKK